MSLASTKSHVSHYNQVDRFSGVNEANPHRLVQMLMDGALGKIAMAKGLMVRNQVGKKGEVIGQAISIIGGLRSSLDMKSGGEIAANLDNLYEYMERQLIQANIKNDTELLDEVVDLLREIKSAWDSIPDTQQTKSF